jgi:hypothetical protein
MIENHANNKLEFLYMDESGDLGYKRGSRFFVIAVIKLSNRRELELCVKRVRQKKLKKNPPSELKAYKATDNVRFALLNHIAEQDIEIYTTIVEKYSMSEKIMQRANDLYNQLACITISHCIRDNCIQLLLVDKRGDHVVRKAFDEYIRLFHGGIKIEHLDSQEDKIMQVVDFVAWSIHRKYEMEDDRFYNLITKKIRAEVLIKKL